MLPISIDSAILWPLQIMLPGATLFFIGIVLMRMHAILATTRAEARMRRMALA